MAKDVREQTDKQMDVVAVFARDLCDIVADDALQRLGIEGSAGEGR